jgi:histidyl-tRNA synthetase
MEQVGITPPNKDHVDVFVAQLGPEAKKKCLPLVSKLRDLGIHTVGALGEASLKSQMRLADRFQAKYTLLLGQMEVKENTIILKDMTAGKQKQIPFDKAIPEVLKVLGKEGLDTYSITDKLGEFSDPGEG